MENNRNEWVMHVWGKSRDTLALTDVEQFHIDMLTKYQEQQKRFDKILINIAMDDINDEKLFDFLKSSIKKCIVNDNVEFKSCQNDPSMGEYVTFRPYVFDRIGEPVNIFYSHFKGYSSYLLIAKESYPRRVVGLCERFWSYMMYEYSLRDFDDVQEKFNNGMSVYAWFCLHVRIDKVDKDFYAYYTRYQEALFKNNAIYKELIEGDLCKFSPGSFLWYNMKNIGESLKDKPEVANISTDYLVDGSSDTVTLCTHFCELYLMKYLRDDECYGVNDFKDEWYDLKNTLYTSIYPAKKVGRDLLVEFERYLIEKELI